VPNKDSIFAFPKGGVFGPYQDNKSYVLAKKIDEKILPDSATVRHILIQTTNPQTGQAMLEDSIAKKRIDSIDLAIQNGANFDSLAKKLSDDKGSADKGGVYDYFPQGQMVKAFNDFVFEGKRGDKKVVKTEFGYHLIEILGQRGSQPHYKIAYLAKEITPSDETDNSASSQANLFSGESRDLKAFNANYDKNLKSKGLNKLVAADIKPGDYSITGLGASRDLVQAIFKADKGDVIEPARVGESYVVATVTEIYEQGIQTPAQARAIVEPILRNEKKAAQITQKLGKITTLDAAATAVSQPVQTADSLRFSGANAVFGFEGKVIGAVFNPANKGKLVPEAIKGQAGVYVLRVENINATPIDNANIELQRQMMQMQTRQAAMQRSPAEALKEAADIKDNRTDFY
jgi:peptidyl-prolyl cis-trans isomerase D